MIYVVVTGLSLPGATVLTLVYGWYFGLLEGIVLVSFASNVQGAITVECILTDFDGNILGKSEILKGKVKA